MYESRKEAWVKSPPQMKPRRWQPFHICTPICIDSKILILYYGLWVMFLAKNEWNQVCAVVNRCLHLESQDRSGCLAQHENELLPCEEGVVYQKHMFCRNGCIGHTERFVNIRLREKCSFVKQTREAHGRPVLLVHPHLMFCKHRCSVWARTICKLEDCRGLLELEIGEACVSQPSLALHKSEISLFTHDEQEFVDSHR